MPCVMIERPKMTRTMYQSLKRHIMKERERIKQEQEQDEEIARQRKERELKKKKEQEDSLSLEQNKEAVSKQVTQCEKKLESLRQDKHELFSQLKKVLHQEDESRKRAQIKENEMAQMQQQYPHPMFLQGPGHMTPHTKYMNMQRSPYGPAKRPRSPSPPPQASVYGTYPPNKYQVAYSSGVKQDGYPNPKSAAYATPSSHVTYVTQSGHTYQTSQHGPSTATAGAAAGIYQTAQAGPQGGQPTPGKYPTSQSAFSSYSSHYAHQQQQQAQQMKEHFQPTTGVPPGYRMQQLPQQGRAYLAAAGHANSSIPLQQQLQHADKKSGFAEDKYKLQTAAVRSMAHIQSHQQGPPTRVSQTQKGGITSGFPVRTQVSSSSFQQSASQAVSSSTQHPYAHGAHGVYYR